MTQAPDQIDGGRAFQASRNARLTSLRQGDGGPPKLPRRRKASRSADGRLRPRPCASECIVVQQEQAQRDGQEIEERVVAGQHNQRLQTHEQPECDRPQPARPDDRERREELDGKHDDGRSLVEPSRKMMGVPGDRRRDGLRFEMERQRGEVTPGWVAARELDGARADHQPKQQPPHQPDRQPRWIGRGPQAIAPGVRRDEDGEQAGFEQQRVPLKREERPAPHRQRQIGCPEKWKDRGRRDPGDEQHRQRDTADAHASQPRVPDSRGQNAVVSHQAEDLCRQRPESDEIDHAQQPKKPPAGERVGGTPPGDCGSRAADCRPRLVPIAHWLHKTHAGSGSVGKETQFLGHFHISRYPTSRPAETTALSREPHETVSSVSRQLFAGGLSDAPVCVRQPYESLRP